MTQHLELQHLKGFAARLHLASHIGSHKKYEPARNVNKALETFTDDLWHHRYKSLEQAFQALQTEIDSKLEFFGDTLPPGLRGRLEKLRDSLPKWSCNNCKNKHKLTDYCLPNEKTYAKVSAGGECIAPVKALCKGIYKWVKNEVFWPRDNAPEPVITLATVHRAFERPPEIVRRFAVGGWASVVKGGEPNTTVGIDISDRAFGWEQYCVLPYLLLHEIVCHGLQSLDGQGPRINADPDDAWSEGWMDRLAYMLAHQWLDKAGGWVLTLDDQDMVGGCALAPDDDQEIARGWALTQDDKDMAVKQTIELHEARYEMAALSLGPRYGREVFDKVQKSYGALITGVQLSRQPITQLSLRLNACTLPKEERLTLLKNFDTLSTTDPSALHSACAKFIAHPNIDRLRAALG